VATECAEHCWNWKQFH